MGSRPQSLAALADSPVGLAAFLLDHDRDSLALISRSFAGHDEGLTRDDVLDNMTLFRLTNTALPAARLYAENTAPFFGAKGVTLPVTVSVCPDELYQAPLSWAQQAYPNLVQYNWLPKGGHFAAWEQPELFVQEVRTGLRSLRQTTPPPPPSGEGRTRHPRGAPAGVSGERTGGVGRPGSAFREPVSARAVRAPPPSGTHRHHRSPAARTAHGNRSAHPSPAAGPGSGGRRGGRPGPR